MTHPIASHFASRITLALLLGLSPQLSGCDSDATSPTDSSSREASAKTHDAHSRREAGANVHAKGSHKADGEATPKANEEAGDQQAPSADQADDDKANAQTLTNDSAPSVNRLVIASSVEEREPIEISDVKVREPVVAFLELKHGGDTESGVVVTFEHKSGKKVGFVELKVPANSPRYRTWARTRNISEAGEWTAVVRTAQGDELARQSFHVTG